MSIINPALARMAPSWLSTVYATDEDISIRASGDYAELVPDHQLVIRITDGSLMSINPWVITSATANFIGAGCQPGQVVHIIPNDANVYGADGDDFAVDAVMLNSLTLRRIGMASGSGQRPGHGNLTQIKLSIHTFGPQIEDVSFDLNQMFAIDPQSQFWGPANLYNQRQLRQACVLMVLNRQYKTGLRSKDSDWAAKAMGTKTDLENVVQRLSVGWGKNNQADLPATRQNGRISR